MWLWSLIIFYLLHDIIYLCDKTKAKHVKNCPIANMKFTSSRRHFRYRSQLTTEQIIPVEHSSEGKSNFYRIIWIAIKGMRGADLTGSNYWRTIFTRFELFSPYSSARVTNSTSVRQMWFLCSLSFLSRTCKWVFWRSLRSTSGTTQSLQPTGKVGNAEI